jgi:quaternary ammonium compound-resistance protein SugE
MSWIALLAAGVVEIAWSQSIKPTDGFTRPLPTLLCCALAAVTIYLLTIAMREVPVGTAYTVFTGMGAIGAVTLGIVVSGDPASLGRLLAVALIVGGVVLARLTTSAA